MELFIDTNIFLSFFHYSSDELEELNKLIVLIENHKVGLYLPEQVKNEFYRNRDNKIADALKRLRADNLAITFPQMAKAYPEYAKMKAAMDEFNANKKSLEKKLITDIEGKALKADKIIDELFQFAETIPSHVKILSKAKHRYDIGNPPGKNKSYGDAINWESLIQAVPENHDLHFITDDSDYFSEINNNSFNSFLADEWRSVKNGVIYLYKNLTAFFKVHFPDIKLANELQREIAIQHLANSSSFNETHWAIAKLARLSDFSDSQINSIAKAAITNNQIAWISEDRDVHQTLCEIVMPRHEVVENTVMSKFFEIYALT